MVKHLNPLLLRASWRFFTRHYWQLWLTLLSIALGSAVVVAVDLANNTANQSFARSVNALSPQFSHQIRAVRGLVPDAVYTQIRLWGYRPSTPYSEVTATLNPLHLKPPHNDTTHQTRSTDQVSHIKVTLMGIDPLSGFAFDKSTDTSTATTPDESSQLITQHLQTLMNGEAQVLISSYLAQQTGLTAGDQFTLTDKPNAPLTVITSSSQWPNSNEQAVIIADIATLQELTGIQGLSAIQLSLTENKAEQLRQQLAEAYPNLIVESYQQQTQALSQMTESFRVNLMAMSLLALLIGAFLVYNTMTFSVLQRRKSFAIARMVGVTGEQLFKHLLLEALVLGLVGGLLGVVFGALLGQGLLLLITRTLSDLYVSVSAQQLLLSPSHIAKGMGITLVAVLLATLAPAIEAARVKPVWVARESHLEQGQRSINHWILLAGIALLVVSLLLLQIKAGLVLGFTALFIGVLGYCLCVPAVLQYLLQAAQAVVPHTHWLGKLAIRGIYTSLNRTTLAMIALAVAVASTVGVSIMIGSFRLSVADWLEQTLSSDIYLSSAADASMLVDNSLHPQWLTLIPALKQVESYSTGRSLTMTVNGKPLPALVLQAGPHNQQGFSFIDETKQPLKTDQQTAIWQAFLAGEGLFISEPLAYHQQLSSDDVLTLASDKGLQDIAILGVYRDYSSTNGMLVLPRLLYNRYWQDRSLSSIGLKLMADTPSSHVEEQLQQLSQQYDLPLNVRSDQAIRERSLAIFDRTFAITHVLRVLVIIVSFIGVFSALMALFLERSREFSILRATGLTPLQLKGLVTLQALLMGLLAGLLALPLGWMMSDILINIINQRSFGWTMQSHFFIGIPLQAIALSVLAALLASLYPLHRLSQLSIQQGLRTL